MHLYCIAAMLHFHEEFFFCKMVANSSKKFTVDMVIDHADLMLLYKIRNFHCQNASFNFSQVLSHFATSRGRFSQRKSIFLVLSLKLRKFY